MGLTETKNTGYKSHFTINPSHHNILKKSYSFSFAFFEFWAHLS